DLRRDDAEATVEQIKTGGGEAVAFEADVRDYDRAVQVVEELIKQWGSVDILVNNAGVIRDKLLMAMEPEDWRIVIDINAVGAFNFTRAVIPHMVRARRGCIINISSVSATFGGRGQVNYSASKGAVNSFTRSLASEVAKRGVRVNAIAPGMIETEMSKAVRSSWGEEILKTIPLKRFGKPEDIAAVALFLASPAASYVTGQVIAVDGGISTGGFG
ncbi:MAG TPA: SDR family oxidoreductase, partial [Planctomycetaceae bacterium]|nr:SDR family oxidoreductase [Planctomycetaceae bacterium]